MNAFPVNSSQNCPSTQSTLFRNQVKISGKYEILLTTDKRIGHEQKIPGDVAVATVRARSNRIQDLKPLVPEVLQALKEAQAGKAISVGRIAGDEPAAVASADACCNGSIGSQKTRASARVIAKIVIPTMEMAGGRSAQVV